MNQFHGLDMQYIDALYRWLHFTVFVQFEAKIANQHIFTWFGTNIKYKWFDDIPEIASFPRLKRTEIFGNCVVSYYQFFFDIELSSFSCIPSLFLGIEPHIE